MQQHELIKVRALSRDYGRIAAVDDVNFELARGEVLGFLGPNGAGKSSTLQMICGCLAPSRGNIEIAGFDLLQQPLQAKRHIGYLPEIPPLYPDLSAREYLRFCARLHRLAKSELQNGVDRALTLCNLSTVADRLIGQLSKGMQQRLGIAQALVHDPALIVLDEPTVGLDPLQIREIRDLITALAAEHAVLMSSHILSEVEAVCSRVLIIHQGRIVHDAAVAAEEGQTHLRLGLDRPPPLDELAHLPGIIEAHELTRGYFGIRLSEARQAPAGILELAVARGWRPFELSRIRSDLEQVFLSLTAADATPDATDRAEPGRNPA